jgi:hypothetical protein
MGRAAAQYYRSKFLRLRRAIRWHQSIVETLTGHGHSLSNAQLDRLLYIIFKHTRRARYIDTIRVATELIRRPNFLNRRGSIAKLLELHAERISHEVEHPLPSALCQPTIVEFVASDERYYLAKLFTEQHFRQESVGLDHCLGRKYLQQYLALSRNGEVEIFSVREIGTHKPVVTIEYRVGTKHIVQLKTERNQLIKRGDPFFPATMEAIFYLATGTAYDRHGIPYRRGVSGVGDVEHLDTVRARKP